MEIVYKTTNLLNGKIYVGVHNGSNPKYLGSGTALESAIQKYGKENFTRETIFEGTEEECLELEEFIVDEQFVLREDTYNLTIGEQTADGAIIDFTGVIPGSTFTLTSVDDPNSFARFVANSSETFDPVALDYEWSVALDATGANGTPAVGQRCLVEIDVPVAAATQYAEQAGSNPTYTGPNVTVTPFLEFNGIDQGATNTSFGVDLEIETTSVPEDWDPISFTQP